MMSPRENWDASSTAYCLDGFSIFFTNLRSSYFFSSLLSEGYWMTGSFSFYCLPPAAAAPCFFLVGGSCFLGYSACFCFLGCCCSTLTSTGGATATFFSSTGTTTTSFEAALMPQGSSESASGFWENAWPHASSAGAFLTTLDFFDSSCLASGNLASKASFSCLTGDTCLSSTTAFFSWGVDFGTEATAFLGGAY